MKNKTQYFLAALLLLLTPFSYSKASLPYYGAAGQLVEAGRSVSGNPDKFKSPGLLKQFRAFKAAKRYLARQGEAGEKASKLARSTLIVLAASMAIPIIFAYTGLASTAIALLALAGFVASIILSIIVLLKEDNPKSRKLARTTLIICGILTIGGLFLTAVLLHFFPNG